MRDLLLRFLFAPAWWVLDVFGQSVDDVPFDHDDEVS